MNDYRALEFGHTLAWFFRDTYSYDGSAANGSIARATQGRSTHDWRGPVVVVRQRGKLHEPVVLEDVTMADVGSAADFFITYVNPAARASESARAVVKGVRVACRGELELGRYRAFVATDVPRDHPIFLAPPSPLRISELVGMPVLVYKLPPSAEVKSRHGGLDNTVATFLHINADPSSPMWGWAPVREWATKVGSILVVRQDGKDLTEHQMMDLDDFCQIQLQPLFEDSLEGQVTSEDVLSEITPARFAACCRMFAKNRAEFRALNELPPE